MKKITELITLEQSYQEKTDALKAEHQSRIVHLQKSASEELQAIQNKLEDKESIIKQQVEEKISQQNQATAKTVAAFDTKKAQRVILDQLN